MDANIEKEGIRNPLRRNLKDSVFSDLFSEEWYATDLARELVPEIPEGTPVSVTNVGGVLSTGPIHDLMLIAGECAIIAAEAQSTDNPNMPFRILFYGSDALAAMTRRLDLDTLGSTRAKIPKFRAFVIYTGTAEVPDVMRLSDSYSEIVPGEGSLEVVAHVIHADNAPRGSRVREYIEFCQTADSCRDETGGDMDKFAHLLKERCEKANILQDYLIERWVEVMGYYEELFSQEAANRHMCKNAWEEGRIEGREEGREEGLAEGMKKGHAEGCAETTEKERREFAIRLLAIGTDPEQVAELSRLSIDYVMELMGSRTNRNMNGSTAVQLWMKPRGARRRPRHCFDQKILVLAPEAATISACPPWRVKNANCQPFS
ncbi:MAG: hypothetical protein E7Z69_03005 [Thermoplasmata archaeon]|nr:hypothetical protein [Thermoplasmata archaeon]